jgi:hypothetical protein
MAAVFTNKLDSNDVWGKHRVIVTTMATAGSDYVTGGFAVTPAQFGMRQIYGMDPIGGNAAGGAYMAAYNNSTGKVQLFNPTNTTPSVGPAVEVSNGGGVAASISFLVIGE